MPTHHLSIRHLIIANIQFQSDTINWLINQQDSIYNVDHNWTSLSTRNEALAIELGAVIL